MHIYICNKNERDRQTDVAGEHRSGHERRPPDLRFEVRGWGLAVGVWGFWFGGFEVVRTMGRDRDRQTESRRYIYIYIYV